MKQAKNGYILVMSLMLLSGILVITSVLVARGALFISYTSSYLKREQAKLLALSGMQLAMSELAESAEPEEPEEAKPGDKEPPKPKEPSEEEDTKELLTSVIPVLNRWQLFPLEKKIDGVTGEIRIAISSEHGKININQIYDFEKKTFKGEKEQAGNWKKLLQDLLKKIPSPQGTTTPLFDALESYLKTRSYPLNEVTELLTIKEFSVFKEAQFYEPPTRATKGKKRPLALTDIFTIATSTDKLQPWLLSDSILGLLNINRAQSDDIQKREKKIDMWLKPFKRSAQWKQEWDTQLKSVYEKELSNLPKGIESFFSNVTNPTIFSVRSHGTVGSVTQRLYAIVERMKKKEKDKTYYTVVPRRVYWL